MRLAYDLGALDLAARRCHNALIACVSVDTKEDTHSDAAPRKPAWMLGLQAFGSILSLRQSKFAAPISLQAGLLPAHLPVPGKMRQSAWAATK